MKSTINICFGLLVLFAASAFGQEVSASITGIVTDASGAAVVGATTTARDMDRGTTWPTATNEAGIYFYPRIPAGRYELKIEAQGFKTAVRPGIELQVNQRARVNISLEVGAVTESIEVTGEAPLLQTDTTIVGTTISQNKLTQTPLISRNFIILTLLTPGVTTTNPSGFNNDRRTTGGGRPYVNGNRKEANNFLLDGIDNNQVSDNLTSYQPNLDAISEVKMITNNASAEFGNFQGGVVNVILKSGTNQLHGSLFHFFKNDKLNANNWARNWLGLQRPGVRYNAFGFTLGGPAYIPGVVNGRDRVFFFMDYQGMRRPTPPTTGAFTVMPNDFRQGNFSRLLNPNADPDLRGRPARVIYNPFSVGGGNRQPFPGNVIPASLHSPVARALLSDTASYLAPNSGALRFNQTNVGASKLTNDQGDAKIDAKVTERDDLSVRYSMGQQSAPGTASFPLLFGSFNESPFKAGVVNWTKTISSRLVNEARFGVNRIVLFNGGAVEDGTPNLNQKYGIAGVDSPGLLSIRFASNTFTSGFGHANIGTQQLFANTTYHYADNLTVISGRHMMKLGGNILRQQMNTFYAGNNGRTGFLSYSGRFTGQTSAAFGWADADFLLGLPETLGRGLDTGTWGHRKTVWGFYFQDDWRILDNLTLNLGLRWEYHTPLVEVNDRQANAEHFTGRLLLAGQDGNSRALYEPYKRDFQPRIGFAWTPKTGEGFVVRGAYTISSFMEGTGTNLRLPLNPPFNSEFEGRYDSPTFALPGSNSSQGLSTLTKADPFRGINFRLWDPFVRPANTQQWNLTVEKQLGGNMVGSMGYVGQKGHRLVVPMPYFQRQLQPNGTVIPSAYLSGNPQLARITQISGTATNGNQQYHSLQSQFTKRWSHGLEFQANYTYSKGMSDAIGYYGEGGQSASQSAYWQNLYDQRAEWGPTYFDARHMFNLTHVWSVPFGRGQHFGSSLHPVANAVLGNWQLGGMLTLRTGFPLTVRGPDNSGSLSRGGRATVAGQGGKTLGEVGRGTRWFDTTAYRIADRGTLGTAGNGTERGPGFKVYDVSIQKHFVVREGTRLEVRGEFINLFNTTQFQSPQRTVNAANFGEVSGSQYERAGQIALRLVF